MVSSSPPPNTTTATTRSAAVTAAFSSSISPVSIKTASKQNIASKKVTSLKKRPTEQTVPVISTKRRRTRQQPISMSTSPSSTTDIDTNTNSSKTNKRNDNEIDQQQQLSKLNSDQLSDVLNSFVLTPFEPFLISEPNVQTILSNYFPVPSRPPLTRFCLRSSDDKADIHVDVTEPLRTISEGEEEDELHDDNLSGYPIPVAVVVPGMESNSRANICIRMANCLRRRGFRVYIINFRSCAGEKDNPSTLRLYHAGFTEDIITLLKYINDKDNKSELNTPTPISIFGFSLGANIVMNLLGRYSKLLHSFNVVAAATVAAPFNPTKCVQNLDVGWKGALYSSRLVRNLKHKVKNIIRNHDQNRGVIDMSALENANRVGKLDEAVIAPVFGYKDRFEYYKDVDPAKWIDKIEIPTLVINAKDDPFFYHHQLEDDQLVKSTPCVRIEWSKNGGHCAFLDEQTTLRDNDGGYFQREITKWFQHVLNERGKNFDV